MNVELDFRAANKDIFEAIRAGVKKIETRAATEKYCGIAPGDTVVLACEGETFEKKIKSAEIFDSIEALLEKYLPQDINPVCATAEDIRGMYHSFPEYEEKIAYHGIIAFELA